ncbi:HAD family hydrolase [uncultured Anaerococcus sp.]|uniref:HAD family hydrolase n=1 Tax=uncultured Anaerococcus sp. TaxID=293428 RepID=UPI00288BF729|nr:HAD family hydrolase [uncultured Anaerococcus sp.]
MIKLFAFDIDGTLLDNNSKVTDESREALKKLDDAGIKVVLASGRVFPSIKYNQKLLGITCPIVATNGSLISLDGREIYKSYYIEDDLLKNLYEFCLEYKMDFHFYDEDNYYTNRLNLDRIKHLKIDNDFGMNYQVDLIIKNDPVSYLINQGKKAIKFQISGIDEKEISKEKIIDLLDKDFGEDLYITASGDSLLEIGNKNATKWTSIEEICDKLGIYTNEVAAIGDAYNDIPMIKGAGLGFAMGNAKDKLKEVADVIVADNESGGALEAVNYVLEANKNV